MPSPDATMTIPIDRFSAARQAWFKAVLPQGVPSLWCPLLTHYRPAGGFDRARMRAHLDALQGSVGALLVPGSTGDGWQLDAAEVHELLAFVLPEARSRGMPVLIGLLKTDHADVHTALQDHLAWLRAEAGSHSDLGALQAAGVCGFTACPPAGADLDQEALREALHRLLGSGLPMALYQLPQVTHNEVSPGTVAWLADRHPNFMVFKDTSGIDRVAAAGVREVLLVRGAEGQYSRHLAACGGSYDGFLLSTANAFGSQLATLIGDLAADRAGQADALSLRIASVVEPVFAEAAGLPFGNAFTNANKAIDHWMAHGPEALSRPAPRLHSGDFLPSHLLAQAGEALRRAALLPTRGYLA